MRDEKILSPADPKGYYAVLGVGPLADSPEIKQAYRKMAKVLHPDFNPSDDAASQFLRIVEAWRVLRDPRARARYDALAAHLPLPMPAFPDESLTDNTEPLKCCRCGAVTAQPRFLVFHRVKSQLIRVRRSQVRGIFCRDCADRTAIRVSTGNWITGWWGLLAPLYNMRALLINLRGGEKPAEDNLRVLLHQSCAFLSRGEPDLAHALADQAQDFARSDEDRLRIARVAAATGHTARRLRNRWKGWGHAALIQTLPLVALLMAGSVAVAATFFRSHTDSVSAGITFHPAQAGEVRHVAVDVLKVRQAPAPTQPVVALLDRFATVQVMDTVGDGEWARILTPSGVTGYVPARFLFGGAGNGPKSRWCTDQKGEPPESGDVLLRRTGGDHRLRVDNVTGKDVVVRLKTPNGRTILAFFVAAESDAQIDGIPDGTFRAVFATGEDYSRACGVFLDDMRTFILPNAQVFHTSQQSPSGPLALTIPRVGEGPGQSRPLPLESFLDN